MSDRKFVVCASGDYAAENAHYRDCEFREIPFVAVNTRRRYASVSWDHISLPSEQDQILQGSNEEITRLILDVYRRHREPTSRFSISALTGVIENLDRGSAEVVAGEIFDILAGCLAGTG
jgi:hypothetical protein